MFDKIKYWLAQGKYCRVATDKSLIRYAEAALAVWENIFNNKYDAYAVADFEQELPYIRASLKNRLRVEREAGRPAPNKFKCLASKLDDIINKNIRTYQTSA